MNSFLDPKTGKQLIWLGIDEYVIDSKEKILKTVLGSCVGIVLFDKEKNFFALNHYLNEDSGAPLTEKMIQNFMNKGCQNIEAAVFGGAHKISNSMCAGPGNVRLAHKILESYNIPIRHSDTGTASGRTITAFTNENSLYVEVQIHDVDYATIKTSPQQAAKEAYKTIKDILEKNKASS